MQIFYWILLLVVVGIAIFAVQNSNFPPITIKFLLWQFKTSLIFTILGSIGIGILMILFLWIPRAVKASIRSRELKKKIEHLETVLNKPKAFGQEGDQSKGL
jgi:uncharacterized integral membrane protein